jgi:ubiquinone biosynthesis protein COQ9
VQFPDELEQRKHMGVGSKVRTLALARLRANAHVIHRWHEACYVRVLFKAMLTRCRQSRSWLAQPTYVPASLSELAKLADEIWFLAGDQMDNSWYTKRVTLSTIYSVTDVFKTQDKSANFTETEQFLDSRLEDLKTVPVGGFMGHFTVNVLRSKGMRICTDVCDVSRQFRFERRNPFSISSMYLIFSNLPVVVFHQ